MLQVQRDDGSVETLLFEWFEEEFDMSVPFMEFRRKETLGDCVAFVAGMFGS